MIEYVNGRQRCACQCHPDWSWLRFGDTTINFSDIDGIFLAEHAGHFLIIEWKKPSEAIPRAQLLALAYLAALPEFTVLVVEGARGMEAMIVRRIWKYRQGQRVERCLGDVENTDKAGLQRRVTDWYDRVHQHYIFRSRLHTTHGTP